MIESTCLFKKEWIITFKVFFHKSIRPLKQWSKPNLHWTSSIFLCDILVSFGLKMRKLYAAHCIKLRMYSDSLNCVHSNTKYSWWSAMLGLSYCRYIRLSSFEEQVYNNLIFGSFLWFWLLPNIRLRTKITPTKSSIKPNRSIYPECTVIFQCDLAPLLTWWPRWPKTDEEKSTGSILRLETMGEVPKSFLCKVIEEIRTIEIFWKISNQSRDLSFYPPIRPTAPSKTQILNRQYSHCIGAWFPWVNHHS